MLGNVNICMSLHPKIHQHLKNLLRFYGVSNSELSEQVIGVVENFWCCCGIG